MLIPMPVLYALYFVFQDTIEFRGVSFLWMVDISQRDPYVHPADSHGAVDVRPVVDRSPDIAADIRKRR